MTTVLEDSASISDWKACSSVLPHIMELEALSGLELFPSNKIPFPVSLVVWEKVLLFV